MKQVGPNSYLHRSAIRELTRDQQAAVALAEELLPHGTPKWDIVRVHRNGNEIMFGWVDDWDRNPHPGLVESVLIRDGAIFNTRSYGSSIPIYHRKEQFVGSGYPNRAKFKALSEQEEAAGLLGRPDIGYRHKWEKILEDKGLQIIDHKLVPV